MAHIMVGIETLGTAPGCVVLSIGAVVFDPDKNTLGAEFHEAIALKSCQALGLAIEADTLHWWLQQKEGARSCAFSGTAGVKDVLERFSKFFTANTGKQVWCHGATFDAPILSAAYKAAGMVEPWKFWDVRDTRTVYDLAGIQLMKDEGVLHNALDDAKRQAKAVGRAYAALASTVLG